MQAKINTAIRLSWLIVFIGLVQPIIISILGEAGDRIIIAQYEQGPYTLNNLVFFLCFDFMFLVAFWALNILTDSIISKALIGFAIGKILDEAVSPFGVWWGEVLWDVSVIGYCFKLWWDKR